MGLVLRPYNRTSIQPSSSVPLTNERKPTLPRTYILFRPAASDKVENNCDVRILTRWTGPSARGGPSRGIRRRNRSSVTPRPPGPSTARNASRKRHRLQQQTGYRVRSAFPSGSDGRCHVVGTSVHTVACQARCRRVSCRCGRSRLDRAQDLPAACAPVDGAGLPSAGRPVARPRTAPSPGGGIHPGWRRT